MINLLSPNDRKQLSAARANTLLLRYNILLGLVIGVLIIEMVGIYFVLGVDKARNEAVIRDNEAKTQAYDSTKIAATQFKSDLTTAKYILSNQVPYTKLITTIANLLPQDAIIDTLALNPATFGTPAQMTIHTKSYESAIAVKQDLQGSDIFTDINFQSVTQGTDSASSAYPFTAVYNVTFSKKAANL
jgi:Tfp pilus assembly protein PilN